MGWLFLGRCCLKNGRNLGWSEQNEGKNINNLFKKPNIKKFGINIPNYKCSKCTFRVCNRCNSLKIKKNSFDTQNENRNVNKKASMFKIQSSFISKSTPSQKYQIIFLAKKINQRLKWLNSAALIQTTLKTGFLYRIRSCSFSYSIN